jgi:hypothetical protein
MEKQSNNHDKDKTPAQGIVMYSILRASSCSSSYTTNSAVIQPQGWPQPLLTADIFLSWISTLDGSVASNPIVLRFIPTQAELIIPTLKHPLNPKLCYDFLTMG